MFVDVQFYPENSICSSSTEVFHFTKEINYHRDINVIRYDCKNTVKHFLIGDKMHR